MLVLVFLGRSKSEQYFGFLPLFSYFNFVLGYIPLVLSDSISQLMFASYILYMFILKSFQKFLDLVTNNLVSNLSNSKNNNYINDYTNSHNNSHKGATYVLGNSFGKNNTFLSKNAIFSKSLNQVKNQLILTNSSTNINTSDKAYQLVRDILHSTLQPKFIREYSPTKHNITKNESYYVDSKTYNFAKTKTTQITLNDIHKISKTVNYPSHFNFNLKTNLTLAQQQR